MHRLVFACIVLALMGQAGWAEGETASSGTDCIQETHYPITPDTVQNNEVFHVVVIGDSIAWGAGLKNDKKYSYLVAVWLSKQLKRPVNVEILAQTGATINTINHPEWAALSSRNPELASEKPTAMEQADSISNPADVDLILVSGGINDVTVEDIIKLDHLEPSESTLYYLAPESGRNAFDSVVSWMSTCSEADLRQKTGNIKPLMQSLLNKLLINCPKASIIVTGYYPIISEKSTGLTEAIRTLMPNSQHISDYQRLDYPVEKLQLRDKSKAFFEESTTNLKAAVNETKSKRVAFAGVEFEPENCYGAEKSWLWRIESGQTRTDDPLYECRVALVGDRNGDKDRTDKVAAVGHPNVKGAEQYFSAIKEAIEKTVPEFLPKVENFNIAAPTTRALGESFEFNYVVSDKGELGLKQVELWRTQEKDIWPKDPIQTSTLAGGPGPVSGSFTDTPPAPGKYWYGVHVVDNAGNWNDQKNSNTDGQPSSFEPVEVEVKNAVKNGQSTVVDDSSDTVQAKVATINYTAYIWNAATGDELHKLDHDSGVWSVAFSPDGSKLATSSVDNIVRIWDVESGEQLHELNHSADNAKLVVFSPNMVVFSPDGSKLATAFYDIVCLWDVASGAQIELNHNDEAGGSVAFSPDGRLLASACSIWDIASGTRLHELRMYDPTSGGNAYWLSEYSMSITFSPDSSKLAITFNGNEPAYIWDVSTGKELQRLEHNSRINSVAFSPDGSRLATASDDYTTRIWDVATGKELHRLVHNNSAKCVVFSPDGSKLATASDYACIWEVASGRLLHQYDTSIYLNSVAFSPDGSKLATAATDCTARIWDVVTGKELIRLNPLGLVQSVSFSHDGSKLATGNLYWPQVCDV